MYAIVDIETTGGNSRTGRITEVAVFVHNGQKVIREFSSLINPQISIPRFVSELTGITEEMVSTAPTFEQIAQDLHFMLAGNIFVAHNVSFDYEYLRQEFRRAGIEFKQKKLCTVRLSRKVFRDLPSYSLNKLSAELSIEMENHHRAASDALATVKIFEKILEKEQSVGLFEDDRLSIACRNIISPIVDQVLLDTMPEDAGVYIIKDREDSNLFVKRSLQIREGILDKLNAEDSKTGKELKTKLYNIDFILTGSLLLAGLIELDMIRNGEPFFNFNKGSVKFSAAIVATPLKDKKFQIAVDKSKPWRGNFILSQHSTFKEAEKNFRQLMEKTGIETTFITHRKGFEKMVSVPVEEDQLEELEQALHFNRESFLILDEGRTFSETAAIAIVEGEIKGYTFFDNTLNQAYSAEDILEELVPLRHHPEMVALIKTSLEKNKNLKIIPFPGTHF